MNCICDISEEALSLSKQFYQVSQHVATYVIYIFCVKKKKSNFVYLEQGFNG